MVQEVRATWQQAPELPRQMQQELAARYDQALVRLVAAWPGAFSGTDLDPEAIVRRSLAIAGEICVYTNENVSIEVLHDEE